MTSINGGLTVVTIWRSNWNIVQASLLEWFIKEPFPRDTHFVWLTSEGGRSEIQLENRWRHMESRGVGYTLELIITEVINCITPVEEEFIEALLYNEALSVTESGWFIFVSDNVIPESGGAKKLWEAIIAQPVDVAMIAAACSRKENAAFISAQDMNGRYLTWTEVDQKSTLEVRWASAAFAIFRNHDIRASGKLFATSLGRIVIDNWIISLCKKLRESNRRVLLDINNRVQNRFPDVFISSEDYLLRPSGNECADIAAKGDLIV
jgi:hypothetical protein